MDAITPPRSQKGSCESWPLLESQVGIEGRKFGLQFKREHHRTFGSGDSCNATPSYTMCCGYDRMLLKWEHYQQAAVLSERMQEDADSDQKKRSLRRFSVCSPCMEEALSRSLL